MARLRRKTAPGSAARARSGPGKPGHGRLRRVWVSAGSVTFVLLLPLACSAPKSGTAAASFDPTVGPLTTQPAPSTPSGSITVNEKPVSLANISTTQEGYALVSTPQVTVGKDFNAPATLQQTAVQYPPLPTECIVSAKLDLGHGDDTFPSDGISVYPSNLAESTTAASSTPHLFRYDTLLDSRPRAVVRFAGAAYSADVTQAARLWQIGGPFPSVQNRVKPGTPFTLGVIYSDITQQDFLVHFDRAVLTLTTGPSAACPSLNDMGGVR